MGSVASADHRELAGWADASSPCSSTRAKVWLAGFRFPPDVITVAVRW